MAQDGRAAQAGLETVLTVSSANLKYGFGATREVGYEMKELGARRIMVVTDPRMAKLPPVAVALDALKQEGLEAALFAESRVEPTFTRDDLRRIFLDSLKLW